MKSYLQFFLYIPLLCFCACSSWTDLSSKQKKKYVYIDKLKDEVLVYPDVFFPNDCTIQTINYISWSVKKGDIILLIGAQAGIQALVVAKLGAGKVVVVDVKEEAIENAKENIEKIGFSDVIDLRLIKMDDPNIVYGNIPKGQLFNKIIFIEMCGEIPKNMDIATFQMTKYRLLKDFIIGLKDYLQPKGLAILEYSPDSMFSKVKIETGVKMDLLEKTRSGCSTFSIDTKKH